MNRFRGLLLILLLAFAFVPAPVSAQSGFPLFDPNWHLVPDAHELDETCPVGAPLAFGAVLQLVQNIMNLAVALTALILIFVIVYAGALFMTSTANAEARSQAKNTLKNAAIGFLIVIAAWLVIDAFMKVLYRGETGNDPDFLPWNQLFVGGPACVKQDANQKSLFGRFDFGSIPNTGDPGSLGGAVVTAPRTGPGACNATTLQKAAQESGITLSSADANTFACIARFESSCGANNLNYAWGRGSSAAGPFQVLLDSNSACYENAACRSAAGVTGELSCSDGFTNGRPNARTDVVRRCVTAASNLNCSLAAAVCIKEKQGFGAWTADKNSRNQQACISGR